MMKPVPNTNDEYYIDDSGVVYSAKYGLLRSMCPKKTYNGYHAIGFRVNGARQYHFVHRLVAQAFIPNPQGHEYVLHKNDIKTDNRACNLYWGTHQDNMDDMVRKGRSASGVRNPNWRGAVNINGVVYSCLSEAARAIGLPYKVLYMRLHRGMAGHTWV